MKPEYVHTGTVMVHLDEGDFYRLKSKRYNGNDLFMGLNSRKDTILYQYTSHDYTHPHGYRAYHRLCHISIEKLVDVENCELSLMGMIALGFVNFRQDERKHRQA